MFVSLDMENIKLEWYDLIDLFSRWVVCKDAPVDRVCTEKVAAIAASSRKRAASVRSGVGAGSAGASERRFHRHTTVGSAAWTDGRHDHRQPPASVVPAVVVSWVHFPNTQNLICCSTLALCSLLLFLLYLSISAIGSFRTLSKGTSTDTNTDRHHVCPRAETDPRRRPRRRVLIARAPGSLASTTRTVIIVVVFLCWSCARFAVNTVRLRAKWAERPGVHPRVDNSVRGSVERQWPAVCPSRFGPPCCGSPQVSNTQHSFFY